MQQAIVTVIVIAAVWVVIARYTPQALRRACRAGLARFARRRGWAGLEKWLTPATADASCADACGSCKGCGPVRTVPETRSAITPEALKRSIPHMARTDRNNKYTPGQ